MNFNNLSNKEKIIAEVLIAKGRIIKRGDGELINLDFEDLKKEEEILLEKIIKNKSKKVKEEYKKDILDLDYEEFVSLYHEFDEKLSLESFLLFQILREIRRIK